MDLSLIVFAPNYHRLSALKMGLFKQNFGDYLFSMFTVYLVSSRVPRFCFEPQTSFICLYSEFIISNVLCPLLCSQDLVKSHLMFAVREEVEVLKEKIAELMERISHLEMENSILKANASQETLALLGHPSSS